MSTIYSTSIEFTPRKMILNMMDLLITIFPSFFHRRCSSHLICLLIFILSRELLEYSENLLILTLEHHNFKVRRSFSHPSVVTQNLISPSLPIVRYQSHLIWLLILILPREYLDSSENLLILTLIHHAFELRRGLSHPSVVTSNLKPPSLSLEIFSSHLIQCLICQLVLILDGQLPESSANHFLSTVLAMISKNPTKDKKMSIQLWLHMAVHLNYILPIYVFISSFISLKNYTGHKLNNPMWLRTEREFMSIYFHGYDYFSNVFFLDYQEQARVSAKRGYVWQEKSSISSAFIFLDYILFH